MITLTCDQLWTLHTVIAEYGSDDSCTLQKEDNGDVLVEVGMVTLRINPLGEYEAQ